MYRPVHPNAEIISRYFKEYVFNDKIDPCNDITLEQLRINRIPFPPYLHRQIGCVAICYIKGCRNQTSNDCYICSNCHPLKQVENFPCFLRYHHLSEF